MERPNEIIDFMARVETMKKGLISNIPLNVRNSYTMKAYIEQLETKLTRIKNEAISHLEADQDHANWIFDIIAEGK